MYVGLHLWRCSKIRKMLYVYKPTRCTKFLWLDFIFQYTLYIFRTVSVHLPEQYFYKLYVMFGICGYDIKFIKGLLLKMDWYSMKHVERIVKMKSNHKNFVHFVCLYTYCKMMHGSYNIKMQNAVLILL
jgi:hypothetical protein